FLIRFRRLSSHCGTPSNLGDQTLYSGVDGRRADHHAEVMRGPPSLSGSRAAHTATRRELVHRSRIRPPTGEGERPMLTVTDRAKERLFEQKQAARIEQAKIGLRVSADSTGQWMLIADHARNDDQVVVQNGSTVLLIDPLAQSVLEGAQVDCVATADGEMELVLGAAPDEDDDDLEEGEAGPSKRPFGGG